ncbi:protein RALF-like 19 [Arachis stenosperma]|uniref:protein RALF-like 19 n=1 Tax=Arachis stenosperma TaxID=217475 RepID=UPI0025AB6EEF|nr:protein RALF-like 19 [Arachis stenosperma]
MGNLLLIFFLAIAIISSKSSSSDSYTLSLINGVKELSTEMAHYHQDDDISRRTKRRRNIGEKARYISYDALKKDKAPCKRRGRSYYGCGRPGKANPYRRGCSAITHCARTID